MRMPRHQFEALVREALDSLPEEFMGYMENLSVEVQDAPAPELAARMGLEHPSDLMGVYTGVPLTEKSVEALVDWPEQIVVFQKNIERACRTRDEMIEEIRITVLHEIAHHFGLDEDDLGELGYR